MCAAGGVVVMVGMKTAEQLDGNVGSKHEGILVQG